MLPWWRRYPRAAVRLFLAVAYRLSPWRRVLFAASMFGLVLGWLVFLAIVASEGPFSLQPAVPGPHLAAPGPRRYSVCCWCSSCATSSRSRATSRSHQLRAEAEETREKPVVVDDVTAGHGRPLRCARRPRRRHTDSRAALLGRARDRRRPRRRLPLSRPPRALQAALDRPRREGRRLGAQLIDQAFSRAWSAIGEQDYLVRPSSATSPAQRTATSWSSSIRPTRWADFERLVFPRQPKRDRICLTDFFRPIEAGGAEGRRRAPRA